MPIDISKLTKAEKRELYDQLAFDLQTKSDLTADDQAMWTTIHDALVVPDGMRQPLSKFVVDYGKKKYREDCEAIRAFVAASCNPVIRRPVRNAVTLVVLNCLVSHLKQRSIPHTPKILLHSLKVLDYAVEQRFPGYAAAKMLERVAPARLTGD